MPQTFSVTGLNCQSCVNHVTAALSGLPGVEGVHIDLDPRERPAFARGVHAQRDRGAGGECGGEKLIGRGAGVGAVERGGLVRDQGMTARLNVGAPLGAG
jgi:copper chaperone CopZ